MKTFGEQLRNYRLGRKMTQQEIADRLGLSSPYIAQMESGFKPPPPQTLVDKLALIVQVPSSERRMFLDAAEKERELQSLVKATRKVGYILSGNKVCVPQKSVSYRVQQEVDEIVDFIPRDLGFNVDLDRVIKGKHTHASDLKQLSSHDDLRSWVLTALGDRPNVWLSLLGILYEVLILTPDERLLCRHGTNRRQELNKKGKQVGQFVLLLKDILDEAQLHSEEQSLPNVIAPHEAWRNIDQALGSPGDHDEMPKTKADVDSIRRVSVVSEIVKGSEELETRSGLGSIGLPHDWFHPDQEYEACAVKSDAYMALGVWPGCKVIYELFGPIQNEDLVICQIGEGRYIRKYYDMGEQIMLQGGPLSSPVQVSRNEPSIRIVGVVRELISRFREVTL